MNKKILLNAISELITANHVLNKDNLAEYKNIQNALIDFNLQICQSNLTFNN